VSAHIIDELLPVAPDIDPAWEARTMRAILGDSRRAGEPAVGRRRRTSAQLLLAVAAVVAIIGGLVAVRDVLPGRPDEASKTMVAADDEPTMYLVGVRSRLLEAVPVPAGTDDEPATPQQRALTAVDELMKVELRDGARYSSFWGTICRLGDGVTSVDLLPSERVVVVTFTSRAGELCDITRGGDDLRGQQLAWTVVTNLGVADTTAVRLVGPDQERLTDDIVPRRSVLATEDR
jgi:hypothetical protein